MSEFPGLAVLQIRDGRDAAHAEAEESALKYLPEPEHHIVIDDADHLLGFAGAIREGWARIAATSAEWVVHHEMDFTFNGPVPVAAMIAALDAHPYIAQMVLARQPINDDEFAQGGVVPLDGRVRAWRGCLFTEHRANWSTNPCVYPAAWCRHPWPRANRTEELWGSRLMLDPDLRFAYWGAPDDPPAVKHIGERHPDGTGY